MDDKTILARFKSARRRSKLEPHKKLIFKLLREEATVREIAHILSEKKQVKVNQSTVSRYIVSQKRLDLKQKNAKAQKGKPHIEAAPLTTPAVSARPQEAKTSSPKNDWRQQVEALKQQPVKQELAEEEGMLAPVGPLTRLPKS